MFSNTLTDRVKTAAAHQWPYILQTLGGLTEQQTDTKYKNTGTPCPLCAGRDRYSFKCADSGGWGCRSCGGGDGWEMLKRVTGWEFGELVRRVAELLHIESPTDQLRALEAQNTARLLAAQRKQEQEARTKQHRHDRAALHAVKIWQSAHLAQPDHPYLLSHGAIPPCGIREAHLDRLGRCLLVPMFNEANQLRNLERITTDGQKFALFGSEKKGLFCQIGRPTFTVFITEGWADAACIHSCGITPFCTVAAFTASNIPAVAAIARRRFPDSQIVIAADYEPTGIKYALKAAKKYDLKIVLPEKNGDFCDLYKSTRRAH